MHAARRARDQAAHGGGRRRCRLATRIGRRHRETEAVDQFAHAVLSELRQSPFDGMIERACERHQRAAAKRGRVAALGARVERAGQRGVVLIERGRRVAALVGNADGGDHLAGRRDLAGFARLVVVAGGAVACRGRAEIGGALAGLVVADDLALHVGRDHDDVRQPPVGRHLRRIERIAGIDPRLLAHVDGRQLGLDAFVKG